MTTKKKADYYEEVREVEDYEPEPRELEAPMVQTYTCSDGKVYDSKVLADSHEADLKAQNTVYVQPVTYYKTSDGKEFPTKIEAEAHEQKLHDPESRITQLENRILELESEVAVLKAKVSLLEDKNKFFPQQPIVKYPDTSVPLPAQPGQFVYGSHPDVGPTYTAYNPVELDKHSDEELSKMGYTVAYAGHKRAIIPGKISDLSDDYTKDWQEWYSKNKQ